MANDAATEWVSPNFINFAAGGSPDIVLPGMVYVLNPNVPTANVTVTFHHSDSGLIAEKDEVQIAPSRSVQFALGKTGIFWVRVKSDQPVFPSGWFVASFSVFHDPKYISYVSMTFYRAEGLKLEEIVTIPKSLYDAFQSGGSTG